MIALCSLYRDRPLSKSLWGVSLLLGVVATVAQAGCAGHARLPEHVPSPFFVTFEKGERTACCGLTLTSDGGIVVLGRADTIRGRSWAWVTKFSGAGSVEWEQEWSSSPEY
jgi:hypothetical protein